MYYNNSMPPWWALPPMGPTSPATQPDPAAQITQWINSLETLKKAFKEEKKEERKKEGPNASVLGMMLFMVLMSPITGPVVYYFFQLSANLVHK